MLTIEEIANKVISGDYGVYPERKKKLESEGYNYLEVQAEVDRILSVNTSNTTVTVIPDGVRGIDISYCQCGMQGFDPTGKGIKFAIIRAGYSNSTDSYLDASVKWCEKYNIPYGFYWYSYAKTPSDAVSEANACIKAISGYSPSYPIFYDLEEAAIGKMLSKSAASMQASAFCDTIKSKGYTAGIYANPDWLINHYDSSKFIDKYDIWLAAWTGSADNKSKYLTSGYFAGLNITMWQFGIDSSLGFIDGDVCFIDYPSSNKSINVDAIVKDEKTLSVHEVALHVIRGKYGNGDARKNALEKEGYSYTEVQAEVNKLLSSNRSK